MINKKAIVLLVGTLAFMASPAVAGWKRIEVEPTQVAKGAFEVTPQGQWNRWSYRIARRGETWTQDGFQLNRLDFFGQIEDGESIYKERNKKENPLPKYRSDMLLTDLTELFEANFSIVNDITQFDIREVEPTKLGGHDGIRLTYEYALPDDALTRIGEARMTVIDGQLYVVNFYAPELHYYERTIEEVHVIMDTIKLK